MCEANKKSQRTCVVCRQQADKKLLLRYVLSPQKDVLVDYRQRLPGRGVYTCITKECLSLAVKRQAFKRGFKQDCHNPELSELDRQLRQAVEVRITNLIGMARKAGIVTTGTNAVIDQIKREPFPVVIVLSSDISEGLAAKIEQAAKQKKIFCVRMFSKAQLGQLMGKDERSAVAFDNSALAGTLKFELERFKQLLREN